MSSLRPLLLVCLCVAPLSACNPHRHYMAVAPGMSQEEVRETMGQRPTAFLDHGLGYVSWKYGDNYCILFRDNAVISKNMMRALAQEATSPKGEALPHPSRPPACPLPKLPPATPPENGFP